jgi:xanthine/CO dehydrogenase XdhC/CoxF family maturation factor
VKLDTDVLAAAARLRAADEPYVIATVVRTRGSSYRRPGARMLATAHARIAGSVSGGCLEASLVRTGMWRTQAGPALVTFDSTDPDDPEAVLGCGGIVDVLLERGGHADDPLAFASRTIAARRRGAIVTIFCSSSAAHPLGTRWCLDATTPFPASLPAGYADAALRAIATGEGTIIDDGDRCALVEAIVPPLALYIFGTGLDAVPLVEAARRLGWSTTLWNGAARPGLDARFPASRILGPDLATLQAELDADDRAVAIVMGHDQRRDRAALDMLVTSRARYIGVLGPRHRTADLAPPSTLADPRVHAPVGLDLGAETPDEIALSVVAEILASERGATGQHLRERPAIHRTSTTIRKLEPAAAF